MARPEHLADLDRRARARFEEAATALRSNLEARLREISEQLFAAVAEVQADLPDSLLDAEALAALEETPRREGERQTLEGLLEATLAFDRAATQGAVLEALLAGARRFAPRAALVLTRHEGWRGWGAAGFATESDPIAGSAGDYDCEALEALASGRGVVVARGFSAREAAVALGLPSAEESCLVPLVLRDQIAAALYVDRREGERELAIAGFQLLAAAAASRIELQPLARRETTPTLVEHAAAGASLPLWSAATVEAAPAPAESAAAGFTVVPDEPAAVTSWSLEAEPEPAVPAEPYEPAPFEPASEPAADEPSRATAPEAPAAVTPEVEPESRAQLEALPEAPDYAAEFVPVEEEAPLMPGEPVFELAPEDEAPSIEFAAAEPEPEGEIAHEADWQAEEGEATAYLGSVATPPQVEVGETTSPVPTMAEEPDLSETRAISPEDRTPPAAAPGGAIEPESSAATIAFQPSPFATRAGGVDPNEDATVMIDRSQTRPALAPPPPAVDEEDPTERTAARPGRSTEVAPPPDLSGPGFAFTSTRGGRATGESALHDEARRLARLLISEIKLYNEDQVAEGRRNRDLYHRLKDDIDRSRQIYEERVHESVRESSDYFQQELVRSLAGGDPRALGV